MHKLKCFFYKIYKLLFQLLYVFIKKFSQATTALNNSTISFSHIERKKLIINYS